MNSPFGSMKPPILDLPSTVRTANPLEVQPVIPVGMVGDVGEEDLVDLLQNHNILEVVVGDVGESFKSSPHRILPCLGYERRLPILDPEEVLDGLEAVGVEEEFGAGSCPPINLIDRRKGRESMIEGAGLDEFVIEALPIPGNDPISLLKDRVEAFDEAAVVGGIIDPVTVSTDPVGILDGDDLGVALGLSQPFVTETQHGGEVGFEAGTLDVEDQETRLRHR